MLAIATSTAFGFSASFVMVALFVPWCTSNEASFSPFLVVTSLPWAGFHYVLVLLSFFIIQTYGMIPLIAAVMYGALDKAKHVKYKRFIFAMVIESHLLLLIAFGITLNDRFYMTCSGLSAGPFLVICGFLLHNGCIAILWLKLL
jgi:hypothetical protein